MRWFQVSATKTDPSFATAMPHGSLNWPSPSPFCPHDRATDPSGLKTVTVLLVPSVTYKRPSGAAATFLGSRSTAFPPGLPYVVTLDAAIDSASSTGAAGL